MNNCRVGDIARYVGAPEHYGKIVGIKADATAHIQSAHGFDGQWWRIDPPILDGTREFHYARDDTLRPLRGGDGPDETLFFAGLPKEVAA